MSCHILSPSGKFNTIRQYLVTDFTFKWLGDAEYDVFEVATWIADLGKRTSFVMLYPFNTNNLFRDYHWTCYLQPQV